MAEAEKIGQEPDPALVFLSLSDKIHQSEQEQHE
jgi:hypothetical protein